MKLSTAAVDEVRHRIQQDVLGRRGRKRDPLYRTQTILRAGVEDPADNQLDNSPRRSMPTPRTTRCSPRGSAPSNYVPLTTRRTSPRGYRIAMKVVDSFHTSPIPEISRLGRTLRCWQSTPPACFTTSRANDDGTEAVNGSIELHPRLARGFRDHDDYRPRMFLVASDLTPDPHPMPEEPRKRFQYLWNR